MTQNIKIWNLTALLLTGLFTFLYIVSSTFIDIFYLQPDPVLGLEYRENPDAKSVVVNSVVPDGPADLVGILAGDIVLAINERRIVGMDALEAAYEEIEEGVPLTLKVTRGNKIIEVTVTPRGEYSVYGSRVFLKLPGLFFCYTLCLIGMFVLFKKPDDKTAQIFYLMVLFWALAMWETSAFSARSLYRLFPGISEPLVRLFWSLAIGTLVHFTLIFPTRKKSFLKHPKSFMLLCYGSIPLLIPMMIAESRSLISMTSIVTYSYGVWYAAMFWVANAMLVHAKQTATNPYMRNQIAIMSRGTMLILALPVGYYFMPLIFLGHPLPYSEYVLQIVVFWPVVLAYAIIKHRFMNINFIIKRGLAYALMSGFVVAAYFLLVVGVGKIVLTETGANSQIVTIIATLLIAALFNPVKNRIQDFVERRFYPSRFTYREAFAEFRHQLVNVIDLQKLLDLLMAFLQKTMVLESTVLFWTDGDSQRYIRRSSSQDSTDDGIMFHADDQVIALLEKKQQLLDFSPLREEAQALSEEEAGRWGALKTELILPLLFKGDLIGFIDLGPKSNGEPFYKEDLELLETLDDQINISLENALLSEELRGQERLRKELEVARRIQLSSLPQCDPNVPGLDISGTSIPAMEVGGDYYDYLHFPDGSFGVVVGDVSGKGTSAALYMSQLKGILRTASRFFRSLKELMVEVNSITFDSLDDQAFITLTCGAFDLSRKRLNLVRAGHLPLLYYSCKNQEYRQLRPNGIGLGLENGEIFQRELEENTIEIETGDVFLFYSDGIEEVVDENGQQFQTRMLMDLISANGTGKARDLRDKIIDRVRAFANDLSQADDMTLVVVKVE